MTAPAVPWPYPRDTPLTRARRIALAYRAALRLNNRDLCDQLDETFTQRGEGWVEQAEVTTDDDGMDAITTAQAAELVHVPAQEIRRWATLPHPHQPGSLLPRFRKQGRDMTYLTRDVLRAAEIMRGPVGLPKVR